jgi:hypothetical protein
MRTDDKFMAQIAQLKDEKAPDALYQRIMTVVPNMAQVGAENPERLSRMQKFFAEWQYGLRVKFASLVVLAVIGFCVGHLKGPSAPQDSFYSSIITGDIGWED